MIKNKKNLFFLSVLFLFSIDTDADKNLESLMSVLYSQTSGEIKATFVQTYNTATELLDQAINTEDWDAVLESEIKMNRTPAIILDVDETVLDIIKSITPKSSELDPVPAWLMLENVNTLLPALTNIINVSLSSGVFPPELKTAIVKPLLKKPSLDKNELKNYRPISHLPFLSKLLEKVVLRQLLAHLEQNQLCNAFQSAYRAGHSTETALLRIMNDLLCAMDQNKVSVLLLLDLSAAFDTIDHSILLSRLGTVFGISSTALSWFESYLEGRSQIVSVDGFSSASTPLEYGVPQGSVLGPILFVLYTTPLSDVIKEHAVSHQLFADDTQIHDSSSPSSTQALTTALQTCTSDIKEWMNQN